MQRRMDACMEMMIIESYGFVSNNVYDSWGNLDPL
jgi:hypothetical protein